MTKKFKLVSFVKCIYMYILIRLEIKKVHVHSTEAYKCVGGGHDTSDKIDKIKVEVV